MKLLWHFNWTKTTTVLTSEQTWKRVALVLLLHMMTSLLVVLYMTHRIHTAYTAHLNVSSILAKHNDSLFGKAVLPHKVIIAGFNTSPFSRVLLSWNETMRGVSLHKIELCSYERNDKIYLN